MQLEMLQIDEAYAAEWVETMRALVARELSHRDFTDARMARLKSWERSRKLAQARLRWKFGDRRQPDLLERDVRRQLVQWAKIDEWKAKMAEAQEQLDAAYPAPVDDNSDRVADGRKGSRPAPRRNPPVRSLDGVAQSAIDMIAYDMEVGDLSTVSDDEIAEYYKSMGADADAVSYYLDLLTPHGHDDDRVHA